MVNDDFSLSTDKLSELPLLQRPKSTVTKWNHIILDNSSACKRVSSTDAMGDTHTKKKTIYFGTCETYLDIRAIMHIQLMLVYHPGKKKLDL